MPKKQEVLVFQEYWQRYGDLDSIVEVAARRAWTFGVLQTQRLYVPVVQENEKLKAEIKKLRDECRRTKRALDGGDSAASQAVSTPEVLSTLPSESTPARRK